MKKPIKVMTSAALASMFAASTLIPTAVAAEVTEVPAEAKVLEFVNIEVENEVLSLPVDTYLTALNAGIIKGKDVASIAAEDGSVYSVTDYLGAFNATGSVEKALELLYKNNKGIDGSDIKEGQIENGKLVPKEDAQPEDRLNETFFYNVA